MSAFTLTLGANSAIACILIGLIFLYRKHLPKTLIEYSNAFAVGILLSLVFFEILPEAMETGEIRLGLWILIGIIGFYLLETVFHFHHCRDMHAGHTYHTHEHKHAKMIFVGTFVDSFFHGVILWSAFQTSVSFGWMLAIGLCLHAIPQNLMNYMMNHKKLTLPLLAATAGVLGSLILLPLQDIISPYKTIITLINAGGLLYLALTDVLPLVKEQNTITGKNIRQCVIIFLGLMIPLCIQLISGHEHGTHSAHSDEQKHAEIHDDIRE